MKLLRKIKEFQVREDGSLLVFFCVCIITLLGIMALSFDMGRRASTQTDLQAFADNVALAAAGELNGSADAIDNAKLAAQNAITAANEALKQGASGTTAVPTFNPDTDLVFYSSLPPSDTPTSFSTAALAASKYTLPTGTAYVTTDPVEATYVGVRLNTVDVDWLFADVFNSTTLPSEAVGAIAIAGNSSWTCDVAPVMFCLPNDPVSHAPLDLSPGQAVNLQSGSDWSPGEFGWLDLSDIPVSAVTSGADCDFPTGQEAQKQACLLAAGIGACFNSRKVDVQTGIAAGAEAAAFNLHFGRGEASIRKLAEDNPALYAPGPHAVTGIVEETNPSGKCTGGSYASDFTMAFPLDDCHADSSCAYGRVGNGGWEDGYNEYFETNYTIPDPTDPDPANPGETTGAPPPLFTGDYFEFPGEDHTTMTRYELYLAEILRAANGGVLVGYDGSDDKYKDDATPPSTATVYDYDSWDDFWPEVTAPALNPIIPDARFGVADIVDNGLAQCDVPQKADPNRRVIIAAGINCDPDGDGDYDDYAGTEPNNVPVEQYYRIFMLSPSYTVSGGGSTRSQMHVEIIEPVGGEGAGGSTVDDGIFRELVQLYR